MAESAVVNASPLIFLSRAGLIDLLQLISAEVIVPESVATEIEVRGKRDPTAQALANTSWLIVTQTPPVPAQIQAWGLGPGESSVLAWAHSHPGSEAIIDDLAARRCAGAFRIPVRGTGSNTDCQATWKHLFGASSSGTVASWWNVLVR